MSWRHIVIALVGLGCFAVVARGQDVIQAGQGSYASFPPAHEGDGPVEMQQRTIYTVTPNAQPIPTNDWWTDLLVSQYAGTMWAYPLAVSADDRGVNVYFPNTLNADDRTNGTALLGCARVSVGTNGSWQSCLMS